MKKTVLTFGVIAGVILSAMMLVTFPLHDKISYERAMVIGYTTMILSFLFVFFGVRSYRDNVGGGVVSFGRAFKVGILIAFIASCCYVATWEVMFYTVYPDYIEKFQAQQIEKIRASGAPPAEIEKKIADNVKFAKLYKNPVVSSAITFVEPLPVGLIVALVSAAILRRRRRDDEVSELATA
jgi:hypothetical protein